LKQSEEREPPCGCLSTEDSLSWERARVTIFVHELRNLLHTLSLNAEVLLSPDQEAREAIASNMLSAIRRMDQLVSSLLDLRRVEAGKLNVAPEPRDAAELVREAVDIFRPLADTKSVSLNVSLAEASLPARIDNDRVFLVLSNLLANAIRDSTWHGRICVSAEKIGEVVQVAVADSGPGIEERELERVFDPYRQIDGSNRDDLGLGLFISKSIVQAHGGQIWAESEPGAGSTFFFTVPGISGIPRSEASPG
jgi:signal transduction histidine kinase